VAVTRTLLEVGAGVGRTGQACGDGLVHRPGLSLGHAAIECRGVAGGTGGGQPGGQVIRHDDAEQGASLREQRLARAEQLASALRLTAAGHDLAQPGERECHAGRTAKLLPGMQRLGKQRPGRSRQRFERDERGAVGELASGSVPGREG
jgi:hypothetical protein